VWELGGRRRGKKVHRLQNKDMGNYGGNLLERPCKLRPGQKKGLANTKKAGPAKREEILVGANYDSGGNRTVGAERREQGAVRSFSKEMEKGTRRRELISIYQQGNFGARKKLR